MHKSVWPAGESIHCSSDPLIGRFAAGKGEREGTKGDRGGITSPLPLVPESATVPHAVDGAELCPCLPRPELVPPANTLNVCTLSVYRYHCPLLFCAWFLAIIWDN